ncbi:LUD domain-containing protein [Halalkalirubrum salinum]|uniref:LUD domain-containing protein n=1 Tax=Halalkalirubrum salinum TaxID=2563889 RepID=UPI0010FAFB55|nr:LUD domain-containing protein [Halalkalirubrum salinum]
MSASPIDRFTRSLEDLDVAVTWTDPSGSAETIETIVEPPCVGTPLPFDDVSVPDVVDTEPTPRSLEAAQTTVTAASMGIGAYGSVVLPSRPDGSEQVSLFTDLHVPVVRESDIVDSMADAIDQLGPRLRDGESAIIATGPSATADMGALVRGAHGPKEVHVVILSTDTEGGQ